MNYFGIRDHLSRGFGIKNTAVIAMDGNSFGLEYLCLFLGRYTYIFAPPHTKSVITTLQFQICRVSQPGPSDAIMQSVSPQITRSRPTVIIPRYCSKRV